MRPLRMSVFIEPSERRDCSASFMAVPMNKLLVLLLLLSTVARADQPTPASLAAATSAEALTLGLQSPDALTRATAARAAMPAGVMAASMAVPDDEIRFDSTWYLIRGYAVDPA